jgi:hypothetical protein
MGPSIVPGDVVGEPTARLDSIDIEKENLVIDLRPLSLKEWSEEGAARIDAIYHVRNNGSDLYLELFFVAAGLKNDSARSYDIWLDGRPVPGTLIASLRIPTQWYPPAFTPPFDAHLHSGVGQGIEYEVFRGDSSAILFAMTLPHGQHTIRVSYRAVPTENSWEGPIKHWQLGYILAPARQWANFGTLQTTVLLPEGWEARTEPEMKRNGDTLTGTWQGLPADAIAITIRREPPSTVLLWMMESLPIPVAAALCVVLCITVGRRAGYWMGRQHRSRAWIVPVALVLGIVSAGIVGLSGLLEGVLVENLLGEQMSYGYRYGATIGLMLFHVPLALIGCVIISAVVTAKAQRKMAVETMQDIESI